MFYHEIRRILFGKGIFLENNVQISKISIEITFMTDFPC